MLNKKKYIIKTFCYSNIHQTSLDIEKVTVSHSINSNITLKTLTKISTFLELITNQRGFFVRSKKSIAMLKIRRGAPMGLKVTLRKTLKELFLKKLVWQVLPTINFFYTNLNLNSFKKKSINSVLFTIPSPLFFFELQSYYFFFKAFKNLRVLISFSSKAQSNEIFFLSRFYQFPFK